MNVTEMSNTFDVLYNNITSNQAPGINEYEKSVFLTKAQNQLLMEYFNNRTDSIGGGFDGSQKRQYDFSVLIRTANLFNVNSIKSTRIDDSEKLDKRSLVYVFPADYFLSVNELMSDNQYQYSVLPIDYAEYSRLMLKPYAFPVRRGAWRLITEKKNCNYFYKYATTTEEGKEVLTQAHYSFLSTWADQKRNLSLSIKSTNKGISITPSGEQITIKGVEYTVNDETVPAIITVDKKKLQFKALYDGSYAWREINVNATWNEGVKTYYITTTLDTGNLEYADDGDTVGLLKLAFDLLNKAIQQGSVNKDSDYDILKTLYRTDGFQQMEAPSRYEKFHDNFTASDTDTFLIVTELKQLPMIEIIGKFNTSNPNYQLRYIKALPPIILDDLSSGWYGENVTIDGETSISESALPEECHQEIVERAVTLAKIAYAGSTATVAGSRDNRDNRD